MDITLSGLIIIVGNYGSGKTEVSVNLAVYKRRTGMEVCIADLDLVNPYFRAREAKEAMNRLGIEVVVPPMQYFHADLPILSPAVSGLIRLPSPLTILDAGGDDAGATVLSSLSNVLESATFRMLQVVNPNRPFTNSLEGCIAIRKEIEAASRLKVSGIIGNANLIDETTPETIYEGHDFVRRLSDHCELPLMFITINADLLPRVDISRLSCPVLPLYRQLVPPWRKAGRIDVTPVPT